DIKCTRGSGNGCAVEIPLIGRAGAGEERVVALSDRGRRRQVGVNDERRDGERVRADAVAHDERYVVSARVIITDVRRVLRGGRWRNGAGKRPMPACRTSGGVI